MWSRNARLGPTTRTPERSSWERNGVEQPGGPVQADGGLAGARGSLDADARREVAADDLVLLGLDRRDDVAHRARPRALDLGREDRAVVGAVAPDEALVLVGREPAAVDAEPAPQLDAHRVGRGGAVEGGRDGCPPVDDDGVPRVVGDVSAPDVEGLVGSVVCGRRSGRRTTWCGGRPAATRLAGRGRGRAARSSTRRWPSRRRGGRPPHASDAAGHGRGRGVLARWPGRRTRASAQPCRQGWHGWWCRWPGLSKPRCRFCARPAAPFTLTPSVV